MDWSLPGGHDSWTVTWFVQQWSQISAPEPVDRQLTTPDWSQVGGHQLRKDSGWTVDLNRNLLQRAAYCVWSRLLFPRELDSSAPLNSNYSYWCSAVPAEVTVHCFSQLWVQGQVQKQVCGSQTEQSPGIIKALGNPWKSGNSFQLQMEEGITPFVWNEIYKTAFIWLFQRVDFGQFETYYVMLLRQNERILKAHTCIHTS